MNDVEEHRRESTSGDTVELKRRALALGFDSVGIASLEPNPHAVELDAWLDAGYAGTMTYLHRQAAKRRDPQLIVPEARVAVVTLTNYFHSQGPSPDPGRKPGEAGTNYFHGQAHPPEPGTTARIAQYAWSRDYHDVLGDRLERLAAAVRELCPGAHTRCYVDAGPVPERELAQRAGLGWIGKNTMLIDPEIGSFTFIGSVLTDADLRPDSPFKADRCGSCRACLDACPTDAFTAPHTLDARRCISYLTIEHRGEFADDQQAMVGEWLFGCDVCQDVCPWNIRFARPTSDPDLAPLPIVDSEDWASIDAAAFDRRYGAMPFTRPGLAGMRRNAAAVRANGAPRT
jgi:epoxyqueuosine reductase